MRIYHGTSVENAEKIKKEGFQCSSQNWYVSSSVCAYFYYCEGDEEESRRSAIWNAKLAAALAHSQSTQICIISMEFDGNIEDYLDYSCEDMSDVALEIPLDMIDTKSLQFEYIDGFVPSLSLAYLTGLDKSILDSTRLTPVEYEILNNKYLSTHLSEVACSFCDFIGI